MDVLRIAFKVTLDDILCSSRGGALHMGNV